MKCSYCDRDAAHRQIDQYGEFPLCCFCHVKRGFPPHPDHLNCLKAERRIADGSWKGIEPEHLRPKPPAPTPNEVARIKRALDLFDEYKDAVIGGHEFTHIQRSAIINMLFRMQEAEHAFYGIKVG